MLAAAERIRGRVHRTPTFSSRTLSHTLGEPVWLKAELFQKTGSFKARGVLNKLASLSAEEKARGVIGISAGNHAQALAWGAAAEGIDCLVVMYRNASAAKVAAARGYGAAVDLEAADAVEAFERLDAHIRETGRTLVHPFDDPLVIAGQGTLALELLEDAPDVETILVPTGGGGPRRRGRRRGARPARRGGRAGALDGGARRARRRPVGARDAGLDRGRALGALRAARRRSPCCRRTTSRACSSPRRRSRRRSGSSTPGRSSPASRQERSPSRLSWPAARGSGPVGVVVSGGNVAAETASAILARPMKTGIHPEYVFTHVRCSCGAEFETRSTQAEIHVDVCSACHPFYTGKQKLMDAGGRVERFQRRLEKAGGARRA